MADGKILATIPRTSTEQIQIAINEFKGKKYLDMRVYYTTDEGANWNPTKKGVTFSPDKLVELKSIIENSIEEFNEEIETDKSTN